MVMKKLGKIISAAAVMLFVSTCISAKMLNVLCTTFPVYQITQNVMAGAQNAGVDIMIPSSMGCPHDYTLNPGDMKKLERADILVINGLGMEEFLGAPLKKANSAIIIVDSSEAMTGLLNYTDEKGRIEVNPHIFASPKMAAQMAAAISRGLSKADPADEKIFMKNSALYSEKLNRIADKTAQAVKKLKNNRMVTQHGVFDYYARDFGLEVVAVIQAHAGEDPSAAEVIKIIKDIKAKKAGAIFTEPQYPDKMAKKIAKEAGIVCAQLDPAASGPDNAPVDYYQNVMTSNIKVIEKYLNR
jgi:ABC-type Zn uptake system ZnuABC Zn-binding protein ZnuA